MAIQNSLEFNDIYYPEAYYKISKIITSCYDEEELVNQGEFSVVKFNKAYENIAQVLIFSSKEARLANARPINHINFIFNYDINDNIWKCAYNKLMDIYPDSKEM